MSELRRRVDGIERELRRGAKSQGEARGDGLREAVLEGHALRARPGGCRAMKPGEIACRSHRRGRSDSLRASAGFLDELRRAIDSGATLGEVERILSLGAGRLRADADQFSAYSVNPSAGAGRVAQREPARVPAELA